jgi:hypothetical protein
MHTKSSCSSITVGKQAYIDTAFFTQNDSHNNILKFGRPYGEHTVYCNEIALFVCSILAQLFTISCRCVGDISVSVTDTPALRALSYLQG